MLELFQSWLADNPHVAVVVPMQVLQESWNNVHKIASKKRTPLVKLREALKEAREQAYPPECISGFEKLCAYIEEHDESLVEINIAMENLQDVFASLLSREATVFSVYPRLDEGGMFDIRFGSKTPPGFEDVSQKGGMHYGDLSLWLDFLTGLVYVLDDTDDVEGDVYFLTNDTKPDWMIDKRFPHPLLCFEVFALSGKHLRMMGFPQFKKTVIDK